MPHQINPRFQIGDHFELYHLMFKKQNHKNTNKNQLQTLILDAIFIFNYFIVSVSSFYKLFFFWSFHNKFMDTNFFDALFQGIPFLNNLNCLSTYHLSLSTEEKLQFYLIKNFQTIPNTINRIRIIFLSHKDNAQKIRRHFCNSSQSSPFIYARSKVYNLLARGQSEDLRCILLSLVSQFPSREIMHQACLNLGVQQLPSDPSAVKRLLENQKNHFQLQSLSYILKSIAKEIRKIEKISGKGILSQTDSKKNQSSPNDCESFLLTAYQTGSRLSKRNFSPNKVLKQAILEEIRYRKVLNKFNDQNKQNIHNIVSTNLAKRIEKAKAMNKKVVVVGNKQKQQYNCYLKSNSVYDTYSSFHKTDCVFSNNKSSVKFHKGIATEGQGVPKIFQEQSLKEKQNSSLSNKEKAESAKKLNQKDCIISEKSLKNIARTPIKQSTHELQSFHSIKFRTETKLSNHRQRGYLFPVSKAPEFDVLKPVTQDIKERQKEFSINKKSRFNMIRARKASLDNLLFERNLSKTIHKQQKISQIAQQMANRQQMKKTGKTKIKNTSQFQVTDSALYSQESIKNSVNDGIKRRDHFLQLRVNKIQKALQKQRIQRQRLKNLKQQSFEKISSHSNENKWTVVNEQSQQIFNNKSVDQRQYKIKELHRTVEHRKQIDEQAKKLRELSLSQLQRYFLNKYLSKLEELGCKQ